MMTKHVPAAAFKDKVSRYIAEASAGEEIVITKHGKEAARLVPPAKDRRALQVEAVERMRAIGQRILAKNGPTTSKEIRQWLDEDRK
jgi:prevent-host-death family protein